MAPSDLMTIDETKVVILLPTGDPLKCTRFTYETFPVPEGYPAPERSVRPVSKRFGKVRSEHRERMAQDREQQSDFVEADENLDKEIAPAEEVALVEDDDQSEKEHSVTTENLSSELNNENEKEEAQIETAGLKSRQEDEDDFYVP